MKDKEKQKEKDRLLDLALLYYGGSILKSAGMEKEKSLIQHGTVSTYQHSVNVARTSLKIARRLNLTVDERQMVRGALLHDYYLYDWHIKDPSHKWHGFHHAYTALMKADRDFDLTEKERDIIVKHMFPLDPAAPRFLESWIVTLADKVCAVKETV
jgi:uncharacterized protein